MSEEGLVRLDGSKGEGGGQILRTAISLSMVTGKPFELVNARANRPNPGLRAQHVTCVRAAAEISGGRAEGDEVGSPRVAFWPAKVKPGHYEYEIGTAGAITLLAQALALPLALAGKPSTLKLRGGSHVPHAPSFHYFSLVWAPMVARVGFVVRAQLTVAGFYPEGGGEMQVEIEPAKTVMPLYLVHRGTLVEAQVLAIVGGHGYGPAERLKDRAGQRLREAGILAEQEVAPLIAHRSKGTALMIVGQFEHGRAAATGLGEQGKSAEKLADEVARDFVAFMGSRGAVDPHLADQLLLPVALVAAGVRPEGGMSPSPAPPTTYTTSKATAHLRTNAEVIVQFLDVAIDVRGAQGEEAEVMVMPRP